MNHFKRCRYEVEIGTDSLTGENAMLAEKVLFMVGDQGSEARQASFFPMERFDVPKSILVPRNKHGVKTIVNKLAGGKDNFYSEIGKKWDLSFKLGVSKSALGNLPEDESMFPVSIWLKKTLMNGVQNLVLNSFLMRKPSPPGKAMEFNTDGSNLPWVVEDLRKNNIVRFNKWIAHLKTALPDLEGVKTVERPEDKHRYLIICYKDGLEVPSWMASDGTLRLLALTLPAYLPDFRGIYLIEEPENGIHPRAVETVFQSLSSVYNAQILLATHSPVIVSLAASAQVLCFAKDSNGATDIVRGSAHPALKNWQMETTLGTLFAGGVLG